MRRKVEDLIPDDCGHWDWTPEREGALAVTMKKSGIRVAMALIKTWANAWTTSDRMHEDNLLPCIFGCEGDDALAHYLCCDPLWTAVISCSYKRTELLMQPPLVRLCLETPSVEGARLITIAFSCYHALKLGHRDLVEAGCDSGNFCEMHVKLMSLADAFAKDIIG